MPALKLFGRKWLVGADDMVLPCSFELLLRVMWFFFNGYITYRYYKHIFQGTKRVEYVKVYFIGMLVILLLNIVLLVAIINRSAKGSICDVHARRAVPALVTCKILLLIPEALWNCLGTVWAFTSVIECPHDHFVNTAINVLVCLDWLFFVLLVIAIVLAIDPVGEVKKPRKLEPDLDLDTVKHRKIIRVWTRRFRCVFCWLIRDQESIEALSEIVGLYSMLFRDSDMVPTDLLAGAILLRIKHKSRDHELEAQKLEYSTNMDEVFRDRPNWITLQRAARYMRLSMATYSCTFVLYRHGCTALCRLLKHWRCCACCRKRPVLVADKVHGEDCCGCFYCGCSMAGLKHLAGIKTDDFVYCNFHNKIFKTPVCIVADHPTKSVVVAVRGTISLLDCFTDVVANAEKVDMEGVPEGTKAHKGMLLGAKYLKQQLDESKILAKAFSTYPNYRLVFTGHSLGAAVSVLLGLLFKPQHPELKVYAFSCPSVLTLPAAIYCQSFVFTFGIGDDFAMRASLEKAEKLRADLFEVLLNSRVPKYRVLAYGLVYALCGIPPKHLNTTWHDRPNHLPARNHLPYVLAEVTERQCTDVALYPAGTILHVVRKIKKVKSCPSRCMSSCLKCLYCCCCCYCCCKCLFSCCIQKKRKKSEDMVYGMRWVTPDFFNELRVMPRMLLDHLPENVYEVLREILEEQGIDTTDEEYLQR